MKKSSLIHVAFIMDGNGRWAKARNLPRHLGHKAGCDRVIDIYEACYEKGVKVMSLYAFSTENWNRPQDEISHLFTYLEIFFKKQIKRMLKDGCQIRVSGDISKLPVKTQKVVLDSIEQTKEGKNFVFNICLNYGGKDEILRATKKFAEEVVAGKHSIEDLDNDLFESYLFTNGLPPVDLLIRTSGEQRTSNFMPWQLAYSEFIFTPTAWPDFTKEEFEKCIYEYQNRDRRYGGIVDEK